MLYLDIKTTNFLVMEDECKFTYMLQNAPPFPLVISRESCPTGCHWI